MLMASWSDLGRILVIGPLAYLALVVILRVSGKRTLTKLNAFDLVITVALGSTLATIILNKSVSLAEGVLALAVLIFLQFFMTWISVRSENFQSLIKAQPRLLAYKGKFLEDALRSERMTQEEVLAAIRSSGISDVGGIGAIVLETDGSVSVISETKENSEKNALSTVSGLGPATSRME